MSEQRPFEVGDVVYIVSASGVQRTKVERVTKTQAIIGSRKYRRGDGGPVGGDSWSSSRIKRPTPTLDRQWGERRLRGAASNLVLAIERGISSDIRDAFAVWEKLEKEVNGNV